MPAILTVTDPVVPSSQDLLRAALRRSEARGRQVARRRLMLRWLLWASRQLLLWVALPAAAGLAGWLWWHRSASLPQRPAALPAPAAVVPTAAGPTAAAPGSATPAAASSPWQLPPATDRELRDLQLRLDDGPSSSTPPTPSRRNP